MRHIRKILVIDEKAAADATKEILLLSDVVGTVDVCENVRKAIRYIEQREFIFPEQLPDLALLEIAIPGGEGMKFLEGFRNLNEELKEKIHLVILTSSEDTELTAGVQKHPDVEEVVSKPVTAEKIKDLQLKIWEGLKKEG